MWVGQRKPDSLTSRRYRICLVGVQCLLFLCFCAVVVKCFYLQVNSHSFWEQRGRIQVETTLQVPIYRGTIYDRGKRLLALSVPQRSLFADGKFLGDPRKTALELSPVLEEKPECIQNKFARGQRFIWLKRNLSDQQAGAVAKLKLAGIHFLEEYKRFYPYRQIAGQVLGFVGFDGTGLEGIEKNYDAMLREGFQSLGQQRDGLRKRLVWESQTASTPPQRPGLSLTLDAYVQYLAERELEKAIKRYKAKAGEVVILDPRTFEVLAMANWPPFDPNFYQQEEAENWRNRAITDLFEPGSAFKVFLVAAAIEEGLSSCKDRIYCENGKYKLANHTINDVHPHGWLTLPELVKYSSNIGATKLAMQLGGERYHRFIRAFGFGDRTGIDLPAEGKGSVRSWKSWRALDLAAAGFGQSIGVTALQLTVGTACIANDGAWSQPLVVRGFVNGDGEVLSKTSVRESHQVIRKKTANQIRDFMVEVTKPGGTGILAALDGYNVAGKTGTAQVLEPGAKSYSSKSYTSVFTGFVPAEEPRLAMTVVIHEPHGAIYGGAVAAPVFHDIALDALPYLGAAPSRNEMMPVQIPLQTVQPVAAQQAAAMAQAPSPIPEQPGQMPNLAGLSLKIALQKLAHLSVAVDIVGSGQVVEQHPAAGTPVNSGETVRLLLQSGGLVARAER
jgi:cell division protein FtsI (penicillin-binding protein 3)